VIDSSFACHAVVERRQVIRISSVSTARDLVLDKLAGLLRSSTLVDLIRARNFFRRRVLRSFSDLQSLNRNPGGKERCTMKSIIWLKTTTPSLLITLALLCPVAPKAFGVSPEPDGGYPNGNTAEGHGALFNLATGERNTALGFNTLFRNLGGDSNTATGAGALTNNISGNRNTATGDHTLNRNTHKSDNTANGFNALDFSEGNGNTAIGSRALENNFQGNNNIALGSEAGRNLNGGSNNIDIGNKGVAGEGSTIRIGSPSQTKTFIAGISGAEVTGAAVQVNAAGQLGTAPSSERFKDQIKQMGKTSEAVLALKPVTFRYKTEIDPTGISQFGLVAEEVEKVNADLVVRDKEGKPYSVRYDQVNVMLLNEFLKEHKEFVEEQRKVQKLEATLKAVDERLKEQEAKIERVSEQVERATPARRLASTNR
jgi:Chaperone of endosialidase